MLSRLRWFKRLVTDLPQQLRLAYCLFRDPRVPVPTKAAFAAGMGVIVTPFINLPDMLPLIGELDMLALSLLALKLFISAAPPEVVAEQEQLIIERRSRFDEDVRKGERVATVLFEKFMPMHDDEGPGWSVEVDDTPEGAGGAAAEKSGVVV
jgi:uncharacterized membrane protein YkvA (DUF1232 family)